jgi:hypothetical protein
MTERLASVPTLAELVMEPARIATLPVGVIAGFVVELAALQQQFGARLAAAGSVVAEASPGPQPEDRLLSATEAAARLGISPLTLLRKRHRAPYRDFVVPTGTRRPLFSLRRIQDYITLHAGAASTARRPVLTGR